MRALGPLSVRLRLTLWYSAALMAILLVISGLSYSLLHWSLIHDLDDSLLAVAQVIHDTGYAGPGGPDAGPELLLRQILGPEFYDKFFQLMDPEGRPGARSTRLRDQTLPLSPEARARAADGSRTFETVRLASGERARLLTLPIVHGDRVVQLVQVGIPLARAERAMARYLDTLFVLVPLGLVLAAVGGAAIARSALAPVDTMSRAARRITGTDLGERIPLRGAGDELDHLAETLNAMLDRLEGAFAQMRRFAADAAHDLRTPLTALRGTIEVALRAERSGPEYRRVLASSLEDVAHLIRLAEDLLALSRATEGALPPRTPVELEAVVRDVLGVATRLAEARGVTVRLAESAPLTVLGDAPALRRAVMKLVENAVRYTPAGGKVEIGLQREGAWALVTVADTGVGMSAADLERIFEPFVRLDDARARDTGGAGLGLAIARAVVAAHGGAIGAVSTPGAGSTFTIRLPLA